MRKTITHSLNYSLNHNGVSRAAPGFARVCLSLYLPPDAVPDWGDPGPVPCPGGGSGLALGDDQGDGQVISLADGGEQLWLERTSGMSGIVEHIHQTSPTPRE